MKLHFLAKYMPVTLTHMSLDQDLLFARGNVTHAGTVHDILIIHPNHCSVDDYRRSNSHT
jgi:hypothetical protein